MPKLNPTESELRMMLKQIQIIGATVYDVYARDYAGSEVLLGSTTSNALTIDNVSIGDMARYKDFYIRARYENSGALTSENSNSITINCENCSKPVTIPNMKGWTKQQVEEWASTNGVNVSYSETASNEVDAGLVLSTSPATGTIFPGETLSVVIASAQLVVPNFKNESDFISQYQAWASLNSVNVSIKEEFHATLPKGAYIGSNPGIGSAISPGSTLTITISKGPKGNDSTTPPPSTGPDQSPDQSPDDLPDDENSGILGFPENDDSTD